MEYFIIILALLHLTDETIERGKMKRPILKLAIFICVAACCLSGITQAEDMKPNFLFVWGHDIGYWNISAYNQGMLDNGAQTTKPIPEDKKQFRTVVEKAIYDYFAEGNPEVGAKFYKLSHRK